jgi:3-deoxy-D-manno-octulosonate 8-phosphate phosphatase (KDO 8-P phosphatase)
MPTTSQYNSLPSTITARASKTKLLIMDCDGVLTDGTMFFVGGPDGKIMETKAFHSQDGLGLLLCHHSGLHVGVISGRESQALAEQAARMHIAYVEQGFLDKEPPFKKILSDAGVTAEEAAFIGDDFTDVSIMNKVGFAIAVANARLEVKAQAHYVTLANGGDGAVREVIEIILQARGLWEIIVKKFGLNLPVKP